MKTKSTLLIFAFIIFENVCSQNITLLPTGDAEIQNSVGFSLGAQPNLLIRPQTPSWSSRVVIKFDLSNYSGCTISNAYLSFFERNSSTISRTINVHKLNTNWNEGTVLWSFPWATGGGDFSPTPIG